MQRLLQRRVAEHKHNAALMQHWHGTFPTLPRRTAACLGVAGQQVCCVCVLHVRRKCNRCILPAPLLLVHNYLN